MPRTTQRPDNYAFSLHLHLTKSVAQRVLAQATQHGLSPTQAVLGCLEQYLPKVRVAQLAPPAQKKTQKAPAKKIKPPVKISNPEDDAGVPEHFIITQGKLDLRNDGDCENYIQSPFDNLLEEAVRKLVSLARQQRFGTRFYLKTLIAPYVWKHCMPAGFKKALSAHFCTAMGKAEQNGVAVFTVIRLKHYPIHYKRTY